MSYVFPAVSYAEVKSTLGTSFWIRADSASDYVLDPAFLRFLMIAIGIYALLDQGDAGPQLVGWQLPVLWLAVAGTVLLGYVITLSMLLSLTRRGAIQRHYTPVIFVPILIIAEATRQTMFWLMDVPDTQSLDLVLGDIARDLLVLFLFDLLHVHYVVPTHPLALLTRPDVTRPDVTRPDVARSDVARSDVAPDMAISLAAIPAAAPPSAPEIEAIPAEENIPAAEPDRGTVTIAGKVFALSDLFSVRTEDHYLNVITRSGRSMLRAKLSDITTLHDGRHGVQINRSQWVSFAAIETVSEEENGQVTLQLTGGEIAIVSRTRRLMFMQLYNALRNRQG